MRTQVLRFRRMMEELSAERVALLLSVGLVLGVFPMMGIPTVLCLLAAAGLRLNVAALQLLNSFSSPLQIALLLPLERAGACLCGGVLPANSSLAGRIGVTALHAVVGWACFCIPAGVLLYFLLRYGGRMPLPHGAQQLLAKLGERCH